MTDALHSLEIKHRNGVYRSILPDGSQRKVLDSITSAAAGYYCLNSMSWLLLSQPYEQICISIPLHLWKLTDLRRYMPANKIQIVQPPQVLKKSVKEILLKKNVFFFFNL